LEKQGRTCETKWVLTWKTLRGFSRNADAATAAPLTPAPSGTTSRITAPKKKRKRKRKRKRKEDSESDSSNGDSSSDDEDNDKGKDLLQKLFEDEGQLLKVTGFGVGDADERVLF
jgi:hypothetical protein